MQERRVLRPPLSPPSSLPLLASRTPLKARAGAPLLTKASVKAAPLAKRRLGEERRGTRRKPERERERRTRDNCAISNASREGEDWGKVQEEKEESWRRDIDLHFYSA